MTVKAAAMATACCPFCGLGLLGRLALGGLFGGFLLGHGAGSEGLHEVLMVHGGREKMTWARLVDCDGVPRDARE